MGKAWIPLNELQLPSKCPYCGSTEFIIDGARKDYVDFYVKVEEGQIKIEDEKATETEYRVAYGVACAKCGEDLSDLCGF